MARLVLIVALLTCALAIAGCGAVSASRPAPTPITGADWSVQLQPGADPQAVARDHGATVKGPIAQVPGLWQFSVPAGAVDRLRADPRVVWLDSVTVDTNVPDKRG